jgi:iron complex transport system substrate-binding protein
LICLLLLGLLIACAPMAVPVAPSTPTAAATSADDAFPVTIEHKYGSTEITARPERIVTVGLTEQDALLALGIPWPGARR